MTINAAPLPGSVTAPPGCPVPDRPASAPAPGTVLSSHYDLCVGCGLAHPTGLRLHVTAGAGLTTHGRFTVTDDHQGAPGLAHGGMIALAMDEVLGGLGYLLQKPMVTGRLLTEYSRPIPVGSVLDLEAQVDGVDGRRIFCRAVARTAGGNSLVLARAYAVFVAVDMRHFREHGDAEEVDRVAARVAARAAASAPGPTGASAGTSAGGSPGASAGLPRPDDQHGEWVVNP